MTATFTTFTAIYSHTATPYTMCHQSSLDASGVSVMGKEMVPKLRTEAPDHKAASRLQPFC